MAGTGGALPEGADGIFPVVTAGNAFTFSGLFGKKYAGGITRMSLVIDVAYAQPVASNYGGGLQVGIGITFLDPYRW